MQALLEGTERFPLAAKACRGDLLNTQRLGVMFMHKGQHRFALFIERRRAGAGFGPGQRQQPQPDLPQSCPQAQLVTKLVFIQGKGIPQLFQQSGLIRVRRVQRQQFQGRVCCNGDKVFLFNAAAHAAAQQGRFKQVDPAHHTVPRQVAGAVQHIGIDQPAAAGTERPGALRGLIHQAAAVHIKQLHYRVPVPRHHAAVILPGLRPGGNIRKILRKARQALLPGAAAQLDCTDCFHAAPPRALRFVFSIISQFWAKVIFCYGVKFCAAPLTSPPGWYIVKATSS